MLCTVEVFSNTGFTVDNVPDSASLLRSLSVPSVYPEIIVLQDRGNPSIQIDATWSEIKNADYVCVNGKTYYWVTTIRQVNENMAELYLEMDYLTTIGIDNIRIISGWTTRRHVTVDKMFQNNINEDFVPEQELVMDMGETIEPFGEAYINMICSTVNLAELDFDADTYEDPVNQLKVVVPKIPPSTTETAIRMHTNGGNYEFSLPQTALYNIDIPAVKEKVQSLRSLGIESAITATYKVPEGFLIVQEAEEGRIERVTSAIFNKALNGLPYEYQTVKNAKALSGQYNRYRLYSMVSSDSNEYRADEIYHDDDEYPTVTLFCDPQPEGKAYCRPFYYRGNKDDVFLECVEGAKWQNYQIAFQGASGQAFNDLAQGRKRFAQALDVVDFGAGTATRLTTGALLGGPAGVAGAAVQTATGAARMVGEIHNSEQDYANRKNVQIPDIRYPLSGNLQNYLKNAFRMIRVRLSEADTFRFDAYLTQFGYAVSEPFVQNHFSGRQHFNYIRAQSVNLTTTEPYDMVIRIGAIRQLEAGVRIWHSQPEISKMFDNPIV